MTHAMTRCFPHVGSTLGLRSRRRGSVLIVVMVTVAAMACIVMATCWSMRVELLTSANLAATAQATAIERGAEAYVLSMVTQQGEAALDLDESAFRAVRVGDGVFWILRPDYDDSSASAFGLVSESAKLNINTASFNQLMQLPTMTQTIAGSIVDWRDADSTPTAGGAENETYLALPEPYYAKNSRFDTIEELLLVNGVTEAWLFGDGSAAPLGEMSGRRTSGSSFLTDHWVSSGVGELLTLTSFEPNTSSSGGQRVALNPANQRGPLRNLLRQELGQARGDQVANAIGNSDLIDVFDLYFRTRMTTDELRKVVEKVTASTTSMVHGRVNVNLAPREVLACLPGLTSADVDQLLAQRPSASSTNATDIVWVVDALNRKAIGLGERITGRTMQYSADILAVSADARAFKRVRIVVSTALGSPRIIYRADRTRLGWPMDPQLLASMRASGSVFAASTSMSRSVGGLSR